MNIAQWFATLPADLQRRLANKPTEIFAEDLQGPVRQAQLTLHPDEVRWLSREQFGARQAAREHKRVRASLDGLPTSDPDAYRAIEHETQAGVDEIQRLFGEWPI